MDSGDTWWTSWVCDKDSILVKIRLRIRYKNFFFIFKVILPHWKVGLKQYTAWYFKNLLGFMCSTGSGIMWQRNVLHRVPFSSRKCKCSIVKMVSDFVTNTFVLLHYRWHLTWLTSMWYSAHHLLRVRHWFPFWLGCFGRILWRDSPCRWGFDNIYNYFISVNKNVEVADLLLLWMKIRLLTSGGVSWSCLYLIPTHPLFCRRLWTTRFSKCIVGCNFEGKQPSFCVILFFFSFFHSFIVSA